MDTRKKLLTIAAEEIYNKGYEAASINKILQLAKINKGSMYHFFKSKKELTLAMIEDNVEEYIETKYGSILNAKKDYIKNILSVFREKEKYNIFCGCRLNNLVQELSHKDNDFKIALEKVYFRFEEIIKIALEKAISNNEIKHQDVKRLSIYVVASLEGCLSTAKKSQDTDIFLTCIDELENYLHSLKPQN